MNIDIHDKPRIPACRPCKEESELIRKVKLDMYKALIEHKKDISKVAKVQFFVFLETFSEYEDRFRICLTQNFELHLNLYSDPKEDTGNMGA